MIGSWSQTATAEQDVEAGPVISDGILETQRVVYGTGLDGLHVQMLSTGMEVGPQAGYDIDDGSPDSDTFGGGDAIVSPVIASSPISPGQVYALHNDDNLVTGTGDIALAQVDLSTGLLEQDMAVPGTDGYELRSSPVLTEPDAAGDASLFFVASDGVTPRLFRLDIDDVRTDSASFAANSSSIGVTANMQASPALVYLNDLAGTPTQYVAVGTNGVNQMETYSVSTFAAGPTAATGVGEGETPSVPLTSDGLIPGAPGSGLDTSPYIYLAAHESVFNRVHRFGAGRQLADTRRAAVEHLPRRRSGPCPRGEQTGWGRPRRGSGCLYHQRRPLPAQLRPDLSGRVQPLGDPELRPHDCGAVGRSLSSPCSPTATRRCCAPRTRPNSSPPSSPRT